MASDTTKTLLYIGGAYLFWDAGHKGRLPATLQQLYNQLFGGLIGGGGGGTGGSGTGSGTGGGGTSGSSLTFDQACAKAKAALANLDGRWANASCTEVKAQVCGDNSLFVDRSGQDAEIRKAFSCPL